MLLVPTLGAMNRSYRHTPVRLLGSVCGAAVLTLLAAACSSGSSSSPASSAPPSSSTSASSTPSASTAATVPLVVYSAQGYDKAATQAFTKDTGIPVRLDDNSTGPLLTQIEASKNNPNWGLLWVDGSAAFAGLDQQGLLKKHIVPGGVQFNSLGQDSMFSDGSFVPTHVTMMPALVYDKTKVTNPPTTWQALLSTQWKGTVGTNDPSQSGPTYTFVAGMMNYLGSVSAGEKYFTQLKANGLVIHPTNGPTIQALTSGQIKLALVQSSAGVGAAIGDKNLVVTYIKPTTLLPGGIGIDAKAPPAEQAEAEEFVTWVLSPAGQQAMQTGDPTGDSLYYPVVSGTSPLSAVPPLPAGVTQTIDPYKWGPQEATLNNWFDSNIVR